MSKFMLREYTSSVFFSLFSCDAKSYGVFLKSIHYK